MEGLRPGRLARGMIALKIALISSLVAAAVGATPVSPLAAFLYIFYEGLLRSLPLQSR